MMQHLVRLCTAGCALLVLTAQAQIDTTRGTVGSQLCFHLAISSDTLHACAFRGVLWLSNPTVWYPTTAQFGNSRAVLQRISDTLWLVESDTLGENRLDLCGLVLAASDSLCVVVLDSVTVCSIPQPQQRHVLVVSSIGPPLPYVRFARMEGPYPMPVQRRSGFVVYVGLDASSLVRLQLYDLLGRQVLEYSAPLDRGSHRIDLVLPDGTAPGLYLLQMSSTTGSAHALVIVE